MSESADRLDQVLDGRFYGFSPLLNDETGAEDQESVDLFVMFRAGETVPGRLNDQYYVAFIPPLGWATHEDCVISEVRVMGTDGRPLSVKRELWDSLVKKIPGKEMFRAVCTIGFRLSPRG